MFLAGQAGIGKTRLIRAADRKAEAAGLRSDGGSVAPQDHQVPLASIREMAVGMRGSEVWGSLSEDLLAIDGRHDGDALGARRMIVRAAANRIVEAIVRGPGLSKAGRSPLGIAMPKSPSREGAP